MDIVLDERQLRRALLVGAGAVSLGGLGAELIHYRLPAVDWRVLPLLSLSLEGNLPTWYAATLLFACGAVLLVIAAGVRQARAPFRWRWTLLGAVFVFMSLDEAVEIHEHLGGLVELHGVLYFSWVIPAGALLLLLGLAYLRFLGHLPPTTRRRFIVAGAIYVGGALLLELPLGWWAERAGTDNLGYALIDWVEETLELFGASLFLAALVAHLGAAHGGLRIGSAASPTETGAAAEGGA